MARRFVRDAKGRFAGKGFSGQTGGRGARLKSGKGNTRDTGGARATVGTGKPKGTVSGTKVGRSSDSAERMIKRDIAAKKKSKSEGQQYADTQAKAKASRKAETTKRLESFNQKTQARLDTQTKPPIANKISKSPRQLNKDEKIARDVMTDKRFKSDRQRVTEMQRRGVKPGTDVVGLVANVRSKQGGGTTSKIKPAVSNAREAATNRLKIKTATRRKLKTDRSSVVPANPTARRVQGVRPSSTVARAPRAKGNAPATVANRVSRKAAVNKANLKNIQRAEQTGARQGSQYQRALKSSATLDRAQNFLKTGKLPGKDNSIKAQRSLKAANARVNAKRAARQSGDTASVNVPMKGRRGKQLDASISRNVRQQKATARAESKDRNRQFKADQSKAKQLRGKYGNQLAQDFAVKSGQKVSAVKAAIKTMPPSRQVTLLTKAGREQRAKANFARTSDTRNKPGSTMIRRPTQKMTRGNLRAEKAMEFYRDPKGALKSVNKKRSGFKMPRGMRK
tara:strand:+ start:70 stop:1596 length:1527 start_codon:yes stop_codon:yes gene_type:complete